MEESNNNVPVAYTEESSIDYMAALKRLWQQRKLVIAITAAFCVLGLASALMQKPIYNASCTFVPQTSAKKGSSTLSSLAAMAGIGSLDMGATSELSPLIYPKLLDNVELKKELMYTKFHFNKFDEPVSLFDYYMNPDYQQTSWFDTYLTYSYGLPLFLLGKMLEAVLPAATDEEPSVSADAHEAEIARYSKDEFACAKLLSHCISMEVEKKEGYLTLSCQMGEKKLAAEVCQATLNLLEKYITNFKLEKAIDDHAYIQGLYDEAKTDYEAKQLLLAKFEDENRGLMTATAQIRHSQLTDDYSLAYAMYTELSKQLLQSDMRVKEDTPILAAVKPVSVPNMKSNSRAKTLFVFVFLGALLACGSVIGLDWLKSKGSKWPAWWTLDEDYVIFKK